MDDWLSEADRLGIDELTSFANGLRKDLDAVKMLPATTIIMGWQKEA